MQKQDSNILNLEYLLRQISYHINNSTRCYLTENGMTMARFWVISQFSPDNALTMGDLQKQLFLSPGTVTGLVDGLVEAGFVRRWRDDNDRRLVYLSLTDTGIDLLEKTIQHRVLILQSFLRSQKDINITQLNNNLEYILEPFKNSLDFGVQQHVKKNRRKL